MRILFVAMPDSVHTARWITQISEKGWEIFLFPVYIGDFHAQMPNISAFNSLPSFRRNRVGKIRHIWWTVVPFWLDYILSKISSGTSDKFKELALSLVIRRIKPDIIHSLEIQRAGYLTLAAKKSIQSKFPAWIVTNWGSDIFLFGRLSQHTKVIQAVLESCDYYSCECNRDISLAKQLGFQGKTLPVFPNTGGFRLGETFALGSGFRPSERKKILLKGYQHFAGRALVGLQALRLCTDLLKEYTILVFSAGEEVRIAVELFQQDTSLPVEIVPKIPHRDMLQIYGGSRVYIGLSISDAISTSLLEAMVMGAFPIQSNTACADEWIEDKVSGIIVPPEDPHAIAEAISIALKDDELVDRAAQINASTAQERLDYSKIQPQVVNMYQEIFESLGDGS